jgi:thiol-disulfide isomerase/thioredoxin
MNALNYFSKTGLLFIILLTLVSTSCKKKEGCTDPNAINYDAEAKKDNGSCILVTESRKALLIEFTAAWCPPCGSYGAPTFVKMLEDYGDKVVAIASHGSNNQPDGMTNDYSNAFVKNFPIGGWPSFYLGNKTTTSGTIENDINNEFSMPIVASGALTYKIVNDKIEIKSKVEFFQEAIGDYYLGIYVIESGIDGGASAANGFVQKGTTDLNYKHNHVLRTGAVQSVFGVKITNGTATKGFSIAKDYNITIDSKWVADNLEVVGIIFKQNGATFEYVNAFEGHHLTQSE